MNYRDILTVAKKELKSAFGDKAILAQIIFLPFALVFGYSMLMSVTTNSTTDTDMDNVSAFYINAPEYMAEGFEELGMKSATKNEMKAIKKKITEKEAEVLVVFPEDFAIAEADTTKLSDIEIWYNSSDEDSIRLQSNIIAFLDVFRPSVFTVNADENISYDLGDENYMGRKMLGIILPMMILMGVFMVCMNLAAESIAGDKERGFLNTILIAPVKRSSIAAGKSLCIFVAAIVGEVSAFVGMAFSLPKLASSMGMEGNVSYCVFEYLLLFVVTITAVFALTGILLILSTVAKDVKQATSIAPVFMMIPMLAGMLTMVEDFNEMVDRLGLINAAIPAWNTIIVMQKIIELDYSTVFIGITCIANLLFTVISVFVVGRFFENERIVNG